MTTMENMDHNSLPHDEENIPHYDFEYNFISMPWDDRTKKSKAGIILLMLSILLATFIGVINSFIMQYRFSTKALKGKNSKVAINCQLVKVEDYLYVARIHSVTTLELLCVGAVVSENSVLANGACVKNGPVRLYVGNTYDHRCKKGFTVNAAESIIHNGVIAKNLVLLSTYESMAICSKTIRTGPGTAGAKSRGYVIGRSIHGARTISRQPVTVLGSQCVCPGYATKPTSAEQSNVICAESLTRCPVLAGDLLVQDNTLIGIAATSVYSKETTTGQVCFANLSFIDKEDFRV